jgi:Tfp pilus assembly protein PilW
MKQLQKISRPTGARSGMTLIEMMISVGISVLILGVTMSLIVFSAQTFLTLGNYNDLNYKSRNALDVMTKDFRESKHLIGYVSNSTVQRLIFTNLSGTSPSGFSYNYTNVTSANGTLTRAWGAQNTVMLSNIDNLTFHLFTRNPNTNFTFYPTTDSTVTKLIDVSWKCSRQIYGVKLNTESIQTAKIVVRN